MANATSTTERRSYRTYAYSSFKSEFSQLSRLHWYFTYATEVSTDVVTEMGPLNGKYLMDLRPATRMEGQRLSISAKEFVNMEADAIAQLRTLLLVKGIASLEDYIHRYCSYFGIYRGHVGKQPNRLSEVGRALIAPAMKSSLKPVLSYTSALMGLNLGPHTTTVAEAYQIRCAVAHNGGVVDDETARRVPKLRTMRGYRIQLSWSELQSYLNVVDTIANCIDGVIPAKALNKIETQWLIQDILDDDKELTSYQVRHRLANLYNIKSMPRATVISAEFDIPLGSKVRQSSR